MVYRVYGASGATNPDIGYLVMDLNREVSEEVHQRMSVLATSIRTRILY